MENKTKYLALIHEYYECDNNTPSDKIWGKIVEIENEKEKEKLEKQLLKEWVDDEACGSVIDFIKLEDLNKGRMLEEIW